jgi:protein-tyrosine phosphatase
MIGVLFVCTGNICRSPTAEGIFRAMVERAGVAGGFRIDSAGTYDGHDGEPPSGPAVAIARRRGYDLSALRARPVTAQDIVTFDHVLGMDRTHLAALRRLAPQGLTGKPRLFLADYERALDLIEAGCAALLEQLRATSLTA